MAEFAQPMRFPVDMAKGLTPRSQRLILRQGDAFANRVIAVLTQDDKPFDASSMTVVGTFIRPRDEARIDLEGEAKGNEVSVLLDEKCYEVPGAYTLDIMLVLGEKRRTILTICGEVERKGNGELVISGVVENLDEKIEELRALKAELEDVGADLENAAAAQMAAIQQKGEQTLATIPEEYADLDADVKSLKDHNAEIENILDVTFTNLVDTFTLGSLITKHDGTDSSGFTPYPDEGYIVCNIDMSTHGRRLLSGQKIPVVEGDVYTISGYVKFDETATGRSVSIGIENQYSKIKVDDIYTGDWVRIHKTFTVNAETASYGEARVIFQASNSTSRPLYIRDIQVERGEVLTEYTPYGKNKKSVRLDEMENRINILENGALYEWETAAQGFAALFNDTDNVESFLFFTDPHIAEARPIEARFEEWTEFVAKVYNSTPTSFCVCGGDWIGNSDTVAEACYKLGMIDARMRSLFDGYVPIVGNHDTNYQGESALSNATIRNLWFRREGAAYYRYEGATSAMYVLDCGTDNAPANMSAYRWEQIDWLAKSLKAETAENAILALHIIYNSADVVAALADNAMKVAEAYNARTTITLNGTTYDFTGCTGKVRFAIAGHRHEDITGTLHGIPFVMTTNFEAGNVPTFDLVLADFDAGTAHFVRVGSGESRSVTMA